MLLNESDIKGIIQKSGYLEEQKVITEFDIREFSTTGNYSFEDQDDQKSREIDFFAIKTKLISDDKLDYEIKLNFYICGEVKKKTNPLIFFERDISKYENIRMNITLKGYLHGANSIPYFLTKALKTEKWHHQLLGNYISTQFCEIDRERKEAKHGDLYEKLFIPILKCVDAQIMTIEDNKIKYPRKRYEVHLFQPLIVVSGNLYSYQVNCDELKIAQYILYRRSYSSKTVSRTLLIDVISREYLGKYIDIKVNRTYNSIEKILEDKKEKIFAFCKSDYEWNKKRIVYENTEGRS